MFDSTVLSPRLYVGSNLIVGSGNVFNGPSIDLHQSRIVGDLSVGGAGLTTEFNGRLTLGLGHIGNIFLHNLNADYLDFIGLMVDSVLDIGGNDTVDP